MPRLHIYKNEKETCYAFAEWFAAQVNETLAKQQKFALALPGSDAPRMLYKTFGSELGDKIDWSRVHIFTDALLMPGPGNGSSNQLANIITECIPIAKNQVHQLGSDLPPDGYSNEKGALFNYLLNDNGTTFDLAILGLTEQGDFAVKLSAEERKPASEWITSNDVEPGNSAFDIDIINAAAVKAFVITGKRKQDVVHQVLKGKYEPEKFPAQLIQTVNKTVHWFLDEAAAGKLIKPAP